MEFVNYPIPKEGPKATRANAAPNANPVLRGLPLAIGAAVISRVSIIQSVLYNNAGFGKIADVEGLDGYSPRYDPTVIPILENISTNERDIPVPSPRKTIYADYTAADYTAAFQAGKTTPSAIVEALLPLILRDASPPSIHSTAFLQTQVDLVRAAAAASTDRYKAGKPIGPLDGVPVAVKDEADVKGYNKTFGSSTDYTNARDETSWCVKKLEEAGAVLIGKTSMHEMGLDTTNNNPIAGTPLNPHNHGYYTGGSSGGSGYVVAAGIVPIALGADGGGSIRIPASFCGVYGLKPSHGRISAKPSSDLASTTGVYGPIAGSLDDLELSYRAMAAPDPANINSSQFPTPSASLSAYTSPSTKYIGIVPEWVGRAEPIVKSAFDAMINHYKSQPDYEIVEIDMPLLQFGQKSHALTILSEIRSGVTNAQLAALTSPNQILLSVANQAKATDFLAAMKVRSVIMSHLASLFQRYPGLVIATPTTPIPGWKIENPAVDLARGVSDGDKAIRNMEYVWLANFTGCPCLGFPMGEVSETGVPMGFMGMGEWGSEEGLFEFARVGDSFWNDEDAKVIEKLAGDGVGKLRRPSQKGEGRHVDVLGLVGV